MKKGSGLIEVILYLGVVGLLVASLVGLYLNILSIKRKNKNIIEVNENLRIVAEKISSEIRGAKGVNSISNNTISLINNIPSRNPTVFDLDSNRVRIGFLGNFYPLTSNLVTIESLVFSNLSTGDSKTINIGFEVVGTKDGYRQTIEGNGEVRAK